MTSPHFGRIHASLTNTPGQSVLAPPRILPRAKTYPGRRGVPLCPGVWAPLIALLVVSFLLVGSTSAVGAEPRHVDVCVYGGTSAGVIASVAAKQLGKS